MNAQQAKQIRLTTIMERLGYTPQLQERGGQEYKYLSPFREEKEPSFNVNQLKNAWFDFGAGQGGNSLDFAIHYLRSHGQPSQVKDALAWLQTMIGQGPTPSFSFSQQRAQPAHAPALALLSAQQPLTHPVILTYLTRQRQIPISLIQQYLYQITYENRQTNRQYFAFGMKNKSGGFEVRAASDKHAFKSALGGRDITLIPSPKACPINRVFLFEGMLDFLSLLALQHHPILAGDAIILHSLSSSHRAAAIIRQKNYHEIHTFFDNNRAGKEGTQQFQQGFGKIVIPQSQQFAPHTDLNDALRAKM
ncbi:MAG: CHC2 zinc finger domain-containing protein [Chitinophagales bacterium]|nr:CHC2 zinc finger domain-containing protein [Chitinophagales bacterium]